MSGPLLELRGLTKDFSIGRSRGGAGVLRAVDNVSLSVEPGETVGIVGESGCGKSTLARLALRLLAPDAGRVLFDGRDITGLGERALRPLRRQFQVVFQDPYSSLNPRLKVRDIVAEPIENAGGMSRSAVIGRVTEVLAIVGLPASAMDRYPHAFSGGQRQRIGIARALAGGPRLVVCDEAVSALDVSVQAQVLNLLLDLQRDLGLALLFISHNLAVVRYVARRIAVMYLGRIVELADEAALFAQPQHPYTQGLLAAVPEPDPELRGRRRTVAGDVPAATGTPGGCGFHPRCPRAGAVCRVEAPPLRASATGGAVRCHFAG